MYTLPWVAIDLENRAALEKELGRELPDGHILFRSGVSALARRVDRDDVLFQVAGSPKLAVVHLTYSVESDPKWPTTLIYESFSDFEEQKMKLDVLEYGEC